MTGNEPGWLEFVREHRDDLEHLVEQDRGELAPLVRQMLVEADDMEAES